MCVVGWNCLMCYRVMCQIDLETVFTAVSVLVVS